MSDEFTMDSVEASENTSDVVLDTQENNNEIENDISDVVVEDIPEDTTAELEEDTTDVNLDSYENNSEIENDISDAVVEDIPEDTITEVKENPSYVNLDTIEENNEIDNDISENVLEDRLEDTSAKTPEDTSDVNLDTSEENNKIENDSKDNINKDSQEIQELDEHAKELADEYKERDANEFYNQLNDFETSEDINGNRRLSNEIKEFNMEERDDDKIRERAHCDDTTINIIYEQVDKRYDEFLKKEPELTKDIVEMVNDTNGQMYDLSYRIKQKNSCAGKVGGDIQDLDDGDFSDENIEKRTNEISDILRYTGVYNQDEYVDACNTIKNRLEEKGYQIKVKNRWSFDKPENDTGYRDINMKCRTNDGIPFELQLHTKESQVAKNVTHSFYEETRNSTTKLIEKTNNFRTKNIKTLYNDPNGVNDL